jgi:hypothetical protein
MEWREDGNVLQKGEFAKSVTKKQQKGRKRNIEKKTVQAQPEERQVTGIYTTWGIPSLSIVLWF